MNKLFLFLIFIFCANVSVLCEEPKVAAHGAILIDAETGRVLWGKNEHSPLAMASTTKIMTAVLALESGRMDEIVTVSSKAAGAPKVKMYLSPGEKVRLGDLMLALMLESSNDAAIAIAEHLSGTVEEFCAQMTEKARQLGATNTIFETPNGLDKGDHHSTPHDLALITRYALNVPGFIELTTTPHATFKSDRRSYSFSNRNRLLHEYAGANGVKTGFTNKAGHCFVGAAKREEMQLISVVLASGWGNEGKNQKWVDTKRVLNFGFDNFEFITVIEAQAIAGNIPVTRSRTDSIDFAFDKTVRIPLGNHEKDSVYVELYVPSSQAAPVNQGDLLGIARVFIGTNFYNEIPLTATADATRHDLKTSIEKILNEYFGLITDNDVNIILPEI
ncbi:MAG: D-alanyl-D-alanine carboxypeptidase [Clostridiales bacterium]|jgi:D-alanyl-D-alanine carboxypeptidase (penicillin-binding protein 5/6)|nr:D-alanyl-D-alanine carboxypeptidase [Clostridiales bacterium]